jgi:hypothetical protein
MTSLQKKKKMIRKEQNCSPTKTRGIVHKAGAAAFFHKTRMVPVRCYGQNKILNTWGIEKHVHDVILSLRKP